MSDLKKVLAKEGVNVYCDSSKIDTSDLSMIGEGKEVKEPSLNDFSKDELIHLLKRLDSYASIMKNEADGIIKEYQNKDRLNIQLKETQKQIRVSKRQIGRDVCMFYEYVDSTCLGIGEELEKEQYADLFESLKDFASVGSLPF